MDQIELKRIISQYTTYLQVEKGHQAGTCALYLFGIEYFISFCTQHHKKLYLKEDWEWSDIGVRELEFFLREHLKERHWKVNTIISYLTSIRSFFRFLYETGILKKNPIRHFTMKQQIQELVLSNISEENIKQLFEHPPEASFDGYLNRLLLEMFYGLGITPTKLTRIDSVEIDEEQNRIHIKSGKQTKILPIGPSALEVLNNYLVARQIVLEHTGQKDSLFLISQNGKKLTRKKIVDVLKKELERIGIIGERVHVIRNLSTKHFADHGADVRSLQTQRDMKSLVNLERFKNEPFDKMLRQFRKTHIRDEQS